MKDASAATRAALDRVRAAPSILEAVHAIEEVVCAARLESAAVAQALAEGIGDAHDPLVAVAAVYAAGAAGVDVAEQLVVPLLTGDPAHLREHAAWALSAVPRVDSALGPLRAMVDESGFAGTLADATLAQWGDAARPPDPAAGRGGGPSKGLTVAHLYLHGEIDGSLRHAGRGDTGGIATLLVRLGDALLREPGIERVLTLSRESEHDGSSQTTAEEASRAVLAPGHHYLGIPVPHPAPAASRSWTLRSTALEGLRRELGSAGRVDVLHLRMADVGSWAAAQAARELGIPVVLTLAPDPHALVAAREAAGLTRAGFVEADLAEHLIFRIRLLRALREQAAALVVFPRPEIERDLRTLLHVDVEDVHVIPEGVDVETLDEADRQVALAAQGERPTALAASALEELDDLLATLPPERRGLPLMLSVGRLHAVKGMVTLTRVWAEHPDLASRCNLVIVGGDLDRPTSDEAEQLALLDEVVPRSEGPGRGLLLAGHRTNFTVALWLAAARRGRPGGNSAGGVYACASLKEEFGIALCEALGSGLVVVAPDQGGPPTYLEDGVTGLLTDTSDTTALGAALARALDLAAAEGAEARAAYARQVVLDRFGISTMAASLADVYRRVAS